MTSQVTVRARIRRRVAHDEPIPDEVIWDEETAGTYEEARDRIQQRLDTANLVTAWFVDGRP